MERASPAKRLLSAAAAMGAMGLFKLPTGNSDPHKYNGRDPRGAAGAGRRYVISSWQMPRPTKVRNPKIAAQVNAMHEKWLEARGFKKESASDAV